MAEKSTLNSKYIAEMQAIKKSITSYPGYQPIAQALSEFLPPLIVAGLIGCIIPESGTNHRILNSKEYNGRGKAGTSGWNCGEGLIQWTFWKNKEPLIKKYNADSRSTQKLPTTWSEYSKGKPVMEGNNLVSVKDDGKHISGLTLRNQMLFLVIYYDSVIKSLKNETNLAVITAKIYQQKAGIGYFREISDPVERAYTTSKNKYPSPSGNHYLQSLKIAQEYAGIKNTPSEVHSDVLYAQASEPTIPNRRESSSDDGDRTNRVFRLSSAPRRNTNVLQQDENRANAFFALQKSMSSNTPELGREMYLTDEMLDANILKGSQESKKERRT